jgi:hypothetical protein
MWDDRKHEAGRGLELKSRELPSSCGFDSHLRHQEVNNLAPGCASADSVNLPRLCPFCGSMSQSGETPSGLSSIPKRVMNRRAGVPHWLSRRARTTGRFVSFSYAPSPRRSRGTRSVARRGRARPSAARSDPRRLPTTSGPPGCIMGSDYEERLDQSYGASQAQKDNVRQTY